MAISTDRVFIHLLGKTGTGKSSTGNTILQKKVFNARSGISAVTMATQVHEGYLGTRRIVVVDGPGLVGVDTGISVGAFQGFGQIISENMGCKHAFLIICRYGERFTEEDEEMVNHLKVDLGVPNALENHGIVVLTCGDNFERDTEDTGLTFRQWCQQQRGNFKKLCQKCNYRVLLVDNRNQGYQSGSFNRDLVMEIDRLDQEGALRCQAAPAAWYRRIRSFFCS